MTGFEIAGVARVMRLFAPATALALAFGSMPASAATATDAATTAHWTTLGTNSGPIPNPERMEPANLLRFGDDVILVDAGDGAAEQLAKAGVPIAALHQVILSHLHFDHTAGLFAIIAERYQMLAPGVLTIYGPPGTKATVAGMLSAMEPSPPAGARASVPPSETVHVIEIGNGSTFDIGAIKVRAVANTHYIATPGGEAHVSLSFRFDTPGRSIVYTGDTGPSEKVVALARDADLLVSEIINPDATIARFRRARPDVPEAVWAQVKTHFEREHLPPAAVGQMAAAAHVKALVLTHNDTAPANVESLRPAIAATYHGPVSFAHDLDVF